VFHSLLSGTRTALVAPWDKAKTPVAIHAEPSAASSVRASLEPGVQAVVKECDGTWCELDGKGFDGWIEQTSLWGVYPGEVFD
jgi:SH3-like domain-containing protein